MPLNSRGEGIASPSSSEAPIREIAPSTRAGREDVLEELPPVPVELPLRDGDGVQVLESDRVGDLRAPEEDLLHEHPLVGGDPAKPLGGAGEGGLRNIDTAPRAQ